MFYHLWRTILLRIILMLFYVLDMLYYVMELFVSNHNDIMAILVGILLLDFLPLYYFKFFICLTNCININKKTKMLFLK
jgi:hypothetical protein